MITFGGEELHNQTYNLIITICEEQEMPIEFTQFHTFGYSSKESGSEDRSAETKYMIKDNGRTTRFRSNNGWK